MKCINCGIETENDFASCPNCGAVPGITVAQKLTSVFTDKLFFVICILMAVSCVLSLLGGTLSVLNILYAVFLCLAYSTAKKGEVQYNHLRCVSGTVYASYIISNVLGIMLVVLGVLVAIFGSFMGGSIFNAAESYINSDAIEMFQGALGAAVGVIVGVVLILAGVICLIINKFSMRNFHIFAKSVYQSIESNEIQFQKANTVKTWLTVYAVINGLSALGSLTDGEMMSFVSGGCVTAVTVICSVLVGKYFLSGDNYTEYNYIQE